MNPLGRIANPALEQIAQQGQVSTTKPGGNGDDFSKQLMDVLGQVNDAQNNAAKTETDFMTGRQNVDYHDLMISMEKASIALQLTVNVRNKILDAYQEISKTQV